MRPTRHRRTTLSLALAGVLLNACGGGDGSDAPPDGTVFPLRGPVVAALKAGSSQNFTVSGHCNGSASQTSLPAVPAVFAGVTGFSVVTRESIHLQDCTPSVLSSTTTSYYDAEYRAIAMVFSDGTVAMYGAPTALPESVRHGDRGPLGRVTYFSDSARSAPIGYDDVSFATEPETASTLVFNRTVRSYAMDGTPQQTDQERTRLTPMGALTFVSHEFESHGTAKQRLVLTPAPSGAPPPAAPAPSPAPPPAPYPPPPPAPPPAPFPPATPDTVQPTAPR